MSVDLGPNGDGPPKPPPPGAALCSPSAMNFNRLPCSAPGLPPDFGDQESIYAGKFLCIDVGNVGKLVETEDMKELPEHQKVHL